MSNLWFTGQTAFLMLYYPGTLCDPTCFIFATSSLSLPLSRARDLSRPGRGFSRLGNVSVHEGLGIDNYVGG